VFNVTTSNRMHWRNSMPLGTRGNNKLPYTLTLTRSKTVTGALWCCVKCRASCTVHAEHHVTPAFLMYV
jgi:hypothetical protein